MTTPGTVPADPDAEARVYDWDATDTRFPPGYHIRGDVEVWIPVPLRGAPGTRTPSGSRSAARRPTAIPSVTP